MEATAPDPNWRWWNGLDTADAQRQPLKPSVLAGGDLVLCADLADLAQVVAGLLMGRAPVLIRSVATFEGYDTFPAFSVHAKAEGADGRIAAATYVTCVAVQKTKAEDLLAAIVAAQVEQAQGRAA